MVDVAGDQIQVAIPIQIPQRCSIGIVRRRTDITRHLIEYHRPCCRRRPKPVRLRRLQRIPTRAAQPRQQHHVHLLARLEVVRRIEGQRRAARAAVAAGTLARHAAVHNEGGARRRVHGLIEGGADVGGSRRVVGVGRRRRRGEGGVVVQVDAVDRTVVAGDQIEIAVAVEIPQRGGLGGVRR